MLETAIYRGQTWHSGLRRMNVRTDQVCRSKPADVRIVLQTVGDGRLYSGQERDVCRYRSWGQHFTAWMGNMSRSAHSAGISTRPKTMLLTSRAAATVVLPLGYWSMRPSKPRRAATESDPSHLCRGLSLRGGVLSVFLGIIGIVSPAHFLLPFRLLLQD